MPSMPAGSWIFPPRVGKGKQRHSDLIVAGALYFLRLPKDIYEIFGAKNL
jgi:hypothetical protein